MDLLVKLKRFSMSNNKIIAVYSNPDEHFECIIEQDEKSGKYTLILNDLETGEEYTSGRLYKDLDKTIKLAISIAGL
jgi:hypothetical protein